MTLSLSQIPLVGKNLAKNPIRKAYETKTTQKSMTFVFLDYCIFIMKKKMKSVRFTTHKLKIINKENFSCS